MPCFSCFKRRVLTEQEIEDLAAEAREGVHESQRKYGKYLIKGKYGVEKDISKGMLYLGKSVTQNNFAAYYQLFGEKINTKNHELRPLNSEDLQSLIESMTKRRFGTHNIENKNIKLLSDIIKISVLSNSDNKFNAQNLEAICRFLEENSFDNKHHINDVIDFIRSDDISKNPTVEVLIDPDRNPVLVENNDEENTKRFVAVALAAPRATEDENPSRH